MLVRSALFSHLVLVAGVTSLSADEVSDLVRRCDQELFASPAEVNEVVARAEALVEWAEQNDSPETECRGLIRLAFGELWFGRWRNNWGEKRERALELAESFRGDSIGRAETLMFNGHLKAKFFGEYEDGVADLEHAIAIGEANNDLVFLAKAHFLLANILTMRGGEYEAIEMSLRGIALAHEMEMQELEFNSLRGLLFIDRGAYFNAIECFPWLEPLGVAIGVAPATPSDEGALVEEKLRVIAATRHSVEDDFAVSGEARAATSPEVSEVASSRQELVRAALFLVKHFGEDRDEWSRAEPYVDLLERASRLRGDSINLRYATIFKAVIAARRGEFDVARETSRPALEELSVTGDLETLVSACGALSRAFAIGGSVEDSIRLSDLASEKRAVLESRYPSLSASNAKKYVEVRRTKLDSQRAAAAHRTAERRSEFIQLALAVGAPLVAIGGWVGIGTVQSRRMRRELRSQLDSKTASLRLAMERAERANQAKSDFVARINHELRNPLGAIVNSCDILRSHSNEEELAQTAHSTISAASTALVDVIDDVLDFTRIEAGELEFQPTVFSPKEMLEDVTAISSPQLSDGVKLVTRCAPQLPPLLRTDLPKLRQVLLNLCNNAAKYTSHGRVSVSLDYEPSGGLTETSAVEGSSQPPAPELEAGGVLLIQVADTGAGIKGDQQGYVFDRYQKIADGAGAGLGLYISRAFLECMGGMIECRSKPGVGTTMSVRVPVQVGEGASAAVLPRRPGHAGSGSVLVMDDEELNLRALAGLLQACHFEVLLASTWEDAERLLASGVDYALIDLRMPEVDGFEIAGRVRAMLGAAPRIVAVSGDATQSTRASVEASDFDGFLAKPFRKEELLAALDRTA